MRFVPLVYPYDKASWGELKNKQKQSWRAGLAACMASSELSENQAKAICQMSTLPFSYSHIQNEVIERIRFSRTDYYHASPEWRTR